MILTITKASHPGLYDLSKLILDDKYKDQVPDRFNLEVTDKQAYLNSVSALKTLEFTAEGSRIMKGQHFFNSLGGPIRDSLGDPVKHIYEVFKVDSYWICGAIDDLRYMLLAEYEGMLQAQREVGDPNDPKSIEQDKRDRDDLSVLNPDLWSGPQYPDVV